jgi:hypothetical protein
LAVSSSYTQKKPLYLPASPKYHQVTKASRPRYQDPSSEVEILENEDRKPAESWKPTATQKAAITTRNVSGPEGLVRTVSELSISEAPLSTREVTDFEDEDNIRANTPEMGAFVNDPSDEQLKLDVQFLWGEADMDTFGGNDDQYIEYLSQTSPQAPDVEKYFDGFENW